MGQFLRKENRLLPTVLSSKDIARQYPQLLKRICPSLHFVRIWCYAWDVGMYYAQVLKKDIFATIQPGELEFAEIICVDLFAIKRSFEDCGVPLVERWSGGGDAELSDDEEDLSDENEFYREEAHEEMIGHVLRYEDSDGNPMEM